MCARPFTLLKAAFDPLFPLDSIIMFEQDGAPDLAFIAGMKKDRYVAVTSSGREIELTRVRLHRVPGEFPADTKSVDQKIAFLHQICRAAASDIDLETLWGKCAPEKTLGDSELMKLAFDENGTVPYVRTRFSLIRDRVYFKREKDGFAARPERIIEDLKKAKAVRASRLKLFERTAQFLKARAKEKSLETPQELESAILILKECAASVDPGTEEAFHDAEDIVVQCEKALHLEPQGDLPERAFHVLYKAGIFKKDVNLSVIRHRAKIEFDSATARHAEELEVPRFPEPPTRADYTGVHSITIDDESTRDMDDALSLEEDGDGYRLYVHISDVACAIPRGSALDSEALVRATSIYCPDMTIPMLPETVSAGKLSLAAGEPRPAVTCLFEIDRSFEIRHATIVPSVIKVSRRYTYTEADALLEGGDPFLTRLHSIAAAHEAKRLSDGAAPVQKRDAQAVLGSGGEIRVVEVDEQSPARALIGEIMVLANCVMANYLSAHGIPALYRTQEAPDPSELNSVKNIPPGPARDYAERGKLKRSVVSLSPGFHATLGVHAYLQCTSPIRRYLDLVIQRQLLAALSGSEPPYSNNDLVELSRQLEEPLHRALSISKETKRYWLLRYLEKNYLHSRRIGGIVVRTDTKMPMVELDEVFIIAGARIQNPKLGARYTLNVQHVDPRNDFIRLEEVKPKQNRY